MEEESAPKTLPKVSEKLTVEIARFMGSWWAVIVHGMIFAIWTYFSFSLEIFTLWLSLEAIFIGIFLLMAANKAEIERDRKEAEERAKERRMIGYDITTNHKLVNDVKEIKKSIARLDKALAHLTRLAIDSQEPES